MPLLGRNVLMLVNLAPGITNNSTTSTTGLIDIDSVSYSSANGANSRQNEFLMDGIPNNVSDRVAYIPSVDDVEEFTVQTNALDAEYGHGGGMYVNVTTKSGTNELHGNLYEFFRNDKLNANSFFSNRSGAPRPVFRFNQFGLTAGGPVVKNKVFWFFNWESLRQRTPFTYRITVPTALQRAGRFLADLRSQRRTVPDRRSVDHGAERLAAARPATLFPGNRIPANRINPIAATCARRDIRCPTVPGDPFTGANNYFSVVPAPYDGDNYLGSHRPEYSAAIGCSAAGRTTMAFRERPRCGISAAASALSEGNNRAQTSIGLSDAFTVNPSTVITAQAGFTRWTQQGTHPNFDHNDARLFKSLVSQMQQQIFPRFNIADLYYIGASEGQWFEHTNTYSFNFGVTKIAGSHNMKWGMQGQVKQNNSVAANRPGGEYNFDRGFTQPNPFAPGTNLGNGIASFLLGYPASGSHRSARADSAAGAVLRLVLPGRLQSHAKADVESRAALRPAVRHDGAVQPEQSGVRSECRRIRSKRPPRRLMRRTRFRNSPRANFKSRAACSSPRRRIAETCRSTRHRGRRASAWPTGFFLAP